jgi:hypothetical protein
LIKFGKTYLKKYQMHRRRPMKRNNNCTCDRCTGKMPVELQQMIDHIVIKNPMVQELVYEKMFQEIVSNYEKN